MLILMLLATLLLRARSGVGCALACVVRALGVHLRVACAASQGGAATCIEPFAIWQHTRTRARARTHTHTHTHSLSFFLSLSLSPPSDPLPSSLRSSLPQSALHG